MFSGGPSVCACGARAGHSPTGLPSTSSFVSQSLGVAKCSTVTPRCVDCDQLSAADLRPYSRHRVLHRESKAICPRTADIMHGRRRQGGGAISEYL